MKSVPHLRNIFGVCSQTLGNTRAQLSSKGSQLAAAKDKIASLEGRVNRLQSKVDQHVHEESTTAAQLRGLKGELKRVTKERDELVESLARCKQRGAALEVKLSAVESNLAAEQNRREAQMHVPSVTQGRHSDRDNATFLVHTVDSGTEDAIVRQQVQNEDHDARSSETSDKRQHARRIERDQPPLHGVAKHACLSASPLDVSDSSVGSESKSPLHATRVYNEHFSVADGAGVSGPEHHADPGGFHALPHGSNQGLFMGKDVRHQPANVARPDPATKQTDRYTPYHPPHHANSHESLQLHHQRLRNMRLDGTHVETTSGPAAATDYDRRPPIEADSQDPGTSAPATKRVRGTPSDDQLHRWSTRGSTLGVPYTAPDMTRDVNQAAMNILDMTSDEMADLMRSLAA